jgi:iron complex transport system substrate-binding protein
VFFTRRAAAKAAAVAAAAIITAACGSASQPASEGASASASAGGEWPRTIKHAMGETTIEKQPERVMTLDLSFTNATILLETPVVGFTKYHAADGIPEYTGEAGKKYGAEAIDVGLLNEPSLEKIAAAKPDLIVSAKVRHEALYEQLSAIAPTIMTETTGPTWKENITFLGEALGKEEVAKTKLEAYEAAAKEVGDAINKKAGNPTISVVRFLDGPTRLYQKASFSGHVLRDAGLARPPAQDVDEFAAEISEEKIKDADADKIFVTTTLEEESRANATATKAKFEANPLWKPLEPKVVEVPDQTWMTSVAVQGAWHILADLAKAFDVPAPEPKL